MRAFDLMTVWPRLTWPSPAITTLSALRTERIVVPCQRGVWFVLHACHMARLAGSGQDSGPAGDREGDAADAGGGRRILIQGRRLSTREAARASGGASHAPGQSVERNTRRPASRRSVGLDGSGRYDVATGIGFLDHMLEQLSRHSLIDLSLKAEGDLHIDYHHTTEDTGIVIGQAVAQALGDRKGITRYGSALIPMDETLTRVALDLSNRPYLVWKVDFSRDKLGEMDTELFKEWFQAFAQHAGVTLHVETLYGVNNHHIVESCFKGLARALRQALEIDPRKAEAKCPRPRARSRGPGAFHDRRRRRLRLGQPALGRQGAWRGPPPRPACRPTDRGDGRPRRAVGRADRFVLPGVGAFADCRRGLLAIDGLWQAVEEAAVARGRPFLGICVGMQLMASHGLEHGRHPGFGWIAGEVAPLDAGRRVAQDPPHGLERAERSKDRTIRSCKTCRRDTHVYFVHSYAVTAADAAAVLAECDYGGPGDGGQSDETT